MKATILRALRVDQIQALIYHHQHEAAHASTLPERHDHLRDASDLQRALRDFEDRTEAVA